MSSLLDVALATAEALRMDGAFVAADQAYRTILASHPESGMAWRGFALLAEAAGELELARHIMQERAAPLLPQDQRHLAVTDLLRFIAMKLDSGNPPEEDDSKALSLACDILNALLADARQFAQAADILRPLRQIFPTDACLTEALADVLRNLALCNQHDLPLATAYAEEADALDPDSSEGLTLLARFYGITPGMLEKRLAILDRIIELFDRNALPPPTGSPRGLQDLQVTNASAEQIADALLSDGAVLLRGILDAEAQSHFLRSAQHTPLSGLDAKSAMSWLPPVLTDAVILLLKRPPTIIGSKLVIRTVSINDEESYLAYHQDLTPGCSMGINLWATLDPVDGTRPGLEMLVRRQHKAFVVNQQDMWFHIPDDAVRGVFPDSDFVAPRMDKGDGMMFLFSTIHRTHLTPDMTDSRRSIEVRFA